MKPALTVIAIDLGAETGRVTSVSYDGKRIQHAPIHRFVNRPIIMRDAIYWNILQLWSEVSSGVEKGKSSTPISLGVDSWGVDFGLLDAEGELISSPVHYRDQRTQGMMDAVFSRVPKTDVFMKTGIQFMPINTIYQLMSLVKKQSPVLQIAHTFLTIPDLFNYWFTGERVCEFTNATTTQMLNPITKTWAVEMLEELNFPTCIFPDIVEPGTRLGSYDGITVVATACHDTGSAVVALPAAGHDFAYISSGTWSLVGLELEKPLINQDAMVANVTNEGGVYGTFRLLKNVMGLWILQQCRAQWNSKGEDFQHQDLVELAGKAVAFSALIDPDHPSFLNPGDHPAIIQSLCKETNQPVPESKGAIVRCVLESLALKYRYVLEKLINLTERRVEVIHIIGGGVQNRLLCQMTANATGRLVLAGPIEATTIGNALVQLITMGELDHVGQARQMVSQMGQLERYEPEEIERWEEMFCRFGDLINGPVYKL